MGKSDNHSCRWRGPGGWGPAGGVVVPASYGWRVLIRIEGTDLPGRRAGATADELRLANVHVGVQRKDQPESLVPVSAESATWEFEVTSREVGEGALDVGGPWVHGRPGARFLYLTWGA